MPFCSKCGNQHQDEAQFCPKCGNAIITNNGNAIAQNSRNTTAESEAKLSDKWVWTLACVPIFGMILEYIVLNVVGFHSEWTGIFIFITLNIIFVSLDISELENKGFHPDGWLWLGLLLVPVYLFIRANKTNKKFGYAITWCVLFMLSLLAE